MATLTITKPVGTVTNVAAEPSQTAQEEIVSQFPTLPLAEVGFLEPYSLPAESSEANEYEYDPVSETFVNFGSADGTMPDILGKYDFIRKFYGDNSEMIIQSLQSCQTIAAENRRRQRIGDVDDYLIDSSEAPPPGVFSVHVDLSALPVLNSSNKQLYVTADINQESLTEANMKNWISQLMPSVVDLDEETMPSGDDLQFLIGNPVTYWNRKLSEEKEQPTPSSGAPEPMLGEEDVVPLENVQALTGMLRKNLPQVLVDSFPEIRQLIQDGKLTLDSLNRLSIPVIVRSRRRQQPRQANLFSPNPRSDTSFLSGTKDSEYATRLLALQNLVRLERERRKRQQPSTQFRVVQESEAIQEQLRQDAERERVQLTAEEKQERIVAAEQILKITELLYDLWSGVVAPGTNLFDREEALVGELLSLMLPVDTTSQISYLNGPNYWVAYRNILRNLIRRSFGEIVPASATAPIGHINEIDPQRAQLLSRFMEDILEPLVEDARDEWRFVTQNQELVPVIDPVNRLIVGYQPRESDESSYMNDTAIHDVDTPKGIEAAETNLPAPVLAGLQTVKCHTCAKTRSVASSEPIPRDRVIFSAPTQTGTLIPTEVDCVDLSFTFQPEQKGVQGQFTQQAVRVPWNDSTRYVLLNPQRVSGSSSASRGAATKSIAERTQEREALPTAFFSKSVDPSSAGRLRVFPLTGETDQPQSIEIDETTVAQTYRIHQVLKNIFENKVVGTVTVLPVNNAEIAITTTPSSTPASIGGGHVTEFQCRKASGEVVIIPVEQFISHSEIPQSCSHDLSLVPPQYVALQHRITTLRKAISAGVYDTVDALNSAQENLRRLEQWMHHVPEMSSRQTSKASGLPQTALRQQGVWSRALSNIESRFKAGWNASREEHQIERAGERPFLFGSGSSIQFSENSTPDISPTSSEEPGQQQSSKRKREESPPLAAQEKPRLKRLRRGDESDLMEVDVDIDVATGTTMEEDIAEAKYEEEQTARARALLPTAEELALGDESRQALISRGVPLQIVNEALKIRKDTAASSTADFLGVAAGSSLLDEIDATEDMLIAARSRLNNLKTRLKRAQKERQKLHQTETAEQQSEARVQTLQAAIVSEEETIDGLEENLRELEGQRPKDPLHPLRTRQTNLLQSLLEILGRPEFSSGVHYSALIEPYMQMKMEENEPGSKNVVSLSADPKLTTTLRNNIRRVLNPKKRTADPVAVQVAPNTGIYVHRKFIIPDNIEKIVQYVESYVGSTEPLNVNAIRQSLWANYLTHYIQDQRLSIDAADKFVSNAVSQQRGLKTGEGNEIADNVEKAYDAVVRPGLLMSSATATSALAPNKPQQQQRRRIPGRLLIGTTSQTPASTVNEGNNPPQRIGTGENDKMDVDMPNIRKLSFSTKERTTHSLSDPYDSDDVEERINYRIGLSDDEDDEQYMNELDTASAEDPNYLLPYSARYDAKKGNQGVSAEQQQLSKILASLSDALHAAFKSSKELSDRAASFPTSTQIMQLLNIPINRAVVVIRNFLARISAMRGAAASDKILSDPDTLISDLTILWNSAVANSDMQ